MIDSFSAPGLQTEKGWILTISNDGTFSFMNGRRFQKVRLNALQWQLFANMISRKLDSSHRGRIKLQTETGELSMIRSVSFDGGIDLTMRKTNIYVAPLTRREADQLRKSARLRAPIGPTNSTHNQQLQQGAS